MDAQNYWFSSGATGGGGGNQGDPIGQSLRFRGNEFLTRTFGTPTSTTTQTHSWWMKIGAIQSSGRQFGLYIQSPSDAGFIYLPNNNPNSQAFIWEFAGGKVNTLAEYRDPSAWYNVVVSVDTTNATPGDRIRMFVNGERITQFQTSNTFNPNLNTNCAVLGPVQHWLGQDGSNNFFTGYIADYYAIDGQALEPTEFGRPNGDGVWVPVDYDGDADDYGANGFHLTFEDPDDLGADTAPIGATGHTAANNFTATGFDTAPVGIFSQQQAGSPAGAYEPTPANRTTPLLATFAFDGDLGSQSQVTGNGSWYYWTPTLSNVTSLMFGYNSNSEPTEVRINGNVVTFTVGNNGPATAFGSNFWCIPTVPADGNITEVAFTSSTGTSPTGLAGFLLNGNTAADQVVDNTGVDYDSMEDSPTQNYATINPLSDINGPDGTLNNANLEADDGYNGLGTMAMPPDSGTYYWEGTVEAWGLTCFCGIAQAPPTAAIAGTAGYGWNYPSANNPLQWFENSTDTGATTARPALGTIFGYEYDSDNHTFDISIDGTVVRQMTGIPSEVYFVRSASTSPNTNPSTLTFNFGQQQPFIHRPGALTNDNNLQTQNLPTPTILDGSDNFRALTGTGANILAIAQGTNTTGDNWNPDVNTGFANGLWWVKDMVNANEHQLVDSVRGGNLAFTTPAKGPQAAYVPPTGNSVAWCWGTDNTGLNTNAGFQILTWTGTGAARAISHDLDQSRPLDMILVKMNRADPGNTYVNDANIIFWNSAMPNDGFAYFNLSNQFSTQNTFFNGNPNATLGSLTVGTDPDTNANPVTYGSAADYVGYVWQSIPGYSAFGSYTGNGDPDGPFIYTGFRPAFILTKRSSASEDWSIVDTTRSVNNPAFQNLRPNQTNGEGANEAANAIDILSNGFKLRNSTDRFNGTGTYIYCCFAENPFGGENTAPANAR